MADKFVMNRMFWLDMEMSGLDVTRERILECAVIVTDLELNILETYEAIVHQPDELLKAMDKWCQENHTKSGLVTKVKASNFTETQLDEALCALVEKHYKDKVVLCGNSIGQDRKFVEAYLPKFTAKLHYRMLDVSSIKILFEHMFERRFKKQNKHRALDDIKESIAEFKYYLGFFDFEKIKSAPAEINVTHTSCTFISEKV